jgi:hypothetical protein
MKKLILFITLAALFCFSYSALAEPARDPVQMTTAVAQVTTEAGTVITLNSDKISISPLNGQKVRQKPKIFENSHPVTITTSGFV